MPMLKPAFAAPRSVHTPIHVPRASGLSRTGPLEMMGMRMAFSRNEEIYGESEPADYLYKVVSGTVRTSKVLADGRRQIGGFYIAGDVFGLETGAEHSFSAEAISDCEVLIIGRA